MRLSNLLVVMVASLLLLSQVSAAIGQTRGDEEALETYAFALWLEGQGDFQRAITEYKRAIFMADNPAIVEAATYMIATCYQLGQSWLRGAQAYADYLTSYPEGRYYDRAMYHKATCHFGAEQYVTAKDVIDELIATRPESKYVVDGEFLVALSYFMSSRWEETANRCARLMVEYPETHLMDGIRALHQAALDIQGVKRKSVPQAALYSAIIPGTGQGYAGRGGDGWMAFGLTVGSGWLAADSFDRGDTAAGIVYSLLGISFYSGNIYGAANAAESYNRRQEQRVVEDVFLELEEFFRRELGHPEEHIILEPLK